MDILRLLSQGKRQYLESVSSAENQVGTMTTDEKVCCTATPNNMRAMSNHPSLILIMLKGITRYGPRVQPKTTDKKPKTTKGRAQHSVTGRLGDTKGETGRQKR